MFIPPVNPVSYQEMLHKTQFIYDKNYPIEMFIISSQAKHVIHLTKVELGKKGLEIISNNNIYQVNPY